VLRIAATAAVAVLVLELLRTHVAQRYLIPSRSMEPTLHGDPIHGDIVLVDKAGFARAHRAGALARFDLVVVRDAEYGGRPLVKRAASLGDEMLRIQEGDLFTRPLSGGRWERIQKDPVAAADLRFTFFEHIAGRGDPDAALRYLNHRPAADGRFDLLPAGESLESTLANVVEVRGRNGAVTPILTSVVPIDASFLDAVGGRVPAGGRGSDDIGIEIALELADGCPGLAVGLVVRGSLLVVGYCRDGTLSWRGLPGGPSRGPALGSQVTLTFGYLDGRVFLIVDGVLVALVPHALVGPPAEVMDNGARMGVAGASAAKPAARSPRVRLFHDVYYGAENQPWSGIKEYRVEPEQVFLLGDNTFDSIDSRTRGPFDVADIVGRPVAILGPLARARWLAR